MKQFKYNKFKLNKITLIIWTDFIYQDQMPQIAAFAFFFSHTR